MHDAKNVLESRMLGGGKDPPGSLQLPNLPHALHPRMIDNVTLANLARGMAVWRHESNVSVDRIMTQIFAQVVVHGAMLKF